LLEQPLAFILLKESLSSSLFRLSIANNCLGRVLD